MDNKKELTLLAEKQVNGNVFGIGKLDVLKRYGKKAEVTDLAILLGTSPVELYSNLVSSSDGLKGRTGAYYTCSSDNDRVYYVLGSGKTDTSYCWHRYIGIRPVLKLSKDMFSLVTRNRVKNDNGAWEVKYLEYPQYVESEEVQRILNGKRTKLNETGKYYTFDSRVDDKDSYFEPIRYKEYEYNNDKYIKIKPTISKVLSNNKKYTRDDYIWIKVLPVTWLIDDKTNLLVAKQVLSSGVVFSAGNEKIGSLYDGNFKNSIIKRYLDDYMAHDLFQNDTLEYKDSYDFVVSNKYNFGKKDKYAKLLLLFIESGLNNLHISDKIIAKYRKNDNIIDFYINDSNVFSISAKNGEYEEFNQNNAYELPNWFYKSLDEFLNKFDIEGNIKSLVEDKTNLDNIAFLKEDLRKNLEKNNLYYQDKKREYDILSDRLDDIEKKYMDEEVSKSNRLR